MNELKVIEQNGLIKIYETDKGEQVVQARELHQGLEVTSKFADWIKNRINECDATENVDYTSLSKNLENGGRTKEYILKLDTAKEMAMLERNETGKKYRRYFIQVEKKYKQQLPLTYEEMIIMQARSMQEFKVEVDNKFEIIEEKVDNQITLDHGKQRVIQKAVAKRVIDLLEGKESLDYKRYSKKYFAALYRDIKDRMGVPSYKDVKTKDYDQVLEYIKHWMAPANIKEVE